jgi:hypothetical protein
MKQSLKSFLYGSYLAGTVLLLVNCGNAQTAVSASALPVANNFAATGNPIIKHKYTADPAAFVHQGTVYLYTGHDEAPPRQERYVMNEHQSPGNY